jgi:pimeloyl-ACP methyl ester carboxylesterase
MTATTTRTPQTANYAEPSGVKPRGTVVVLGGRGEGPALYRRLALRLSADAYRVAVLADVDFSVRELGDAAAALVATGELVSPVILAGSDAGAAEALRLAATVQGVDGVVTAGILLPGSAASGPLADRTACPVHLGLLAAEENFRPSAAQPAHTAPAGTDDAPLDLSGVAVPVLAVHGQSDTITGFDDALRHYAPLPQLELWQTVNGKHDAFNDANHRTVAATIVGFLERLRQGAPDTLIIRRIAR